MFLMQETSKTNTLLKTRTKLAFKLSNKWWLKFVVEILDGSIIYLSIVPFGIEMKNVIFKFDFNNVKLTP